MSFTEFWHIYGGAISTTIVCFIAIAYILYSENLRNDIKLQKDLKQIRIDAVINAIEQIKKQDKEIMELERKLNLLNKLNVKPTCTDFKEDIIRDYKNKVTCVDMATKYWLKADTIRKALYRWGVK